VITLGQRHTDNINQIITMSKLTRYLHSVNKRDLDQVKFVFQITLIKIIALSAII
jgi:hypothetical protein